MVTFEYKIVKDWDTSASFENKVNELAKDGWRLTVFESQGSYLYAVMERQIPESQPKNNVLPIKKFVTGMEAKG